MIEAGVRTMEMLSPEEFIGLVQRVFQPSREERGLAVLVDLPDVSVADSQGWHERRRMAAEWVDTSRWPASSRGLEPALVCYRNVRMNNADLPLQAWIWPTGRELPATVEEVTSVQAADFDQVLRKFPLVMAPTEFSATAPLKIAARRLGFRAATMGGFSPEMIPALRIDYELVNRKVDRLCRMIDQAETAELAFHNLDSGEVHELTLDLRYRHGHASGGLFREPGSVGNLPSGEAYIVPYEGEREGEPSLSTGILPVQFGDEIVLYRIEGNRAVGVEGNGFMAEREADHLAREPGYCNLAELGLGVIRDFGIKPCGSILLDEKLGLHIAFGRSDHFGGQVGPAQFSSPEQVVHVDRVYIPEVQPLLRVQSVDLEFPDDSCVSLMRDNLYVIDF